MNKPIIKKSISLSTTLVALFIMGIAMSGLMSQTVYAWCDSSQTNYDLCAAENYDSMPDKRGVDITKFREMIQDCIDGDATGLDSYTGADCANATALCIQNSIRVDSCDGDGLADIANWCNDGKGTDSDNCSRLSSMNQATFDAAKQEALSSARENCIVSGNEADKVRQQQACEAALASCKQPAQIGSRKAFGEYGFNDYQNCLNDTLLSSAKNKEECALRGGSWVEARPRVAAYCGVKKEDGPCEQYKGQQALYEACFAGVRGEDCSKYTNEAQRNACQRGVDNNNDDGEEPNVVDGNLGDNVNGQCGAEARTNLIRCETEGGAAAFNNVLRIFVIVLSFGIGIAAIGGLAFSAIQYAQASDNEGSVSAARERIRNIVIGLFLYGFLLAIVNWLIPGGMFG